MAEDSSDLPALAQKAREGQQPPAQQAAPPAQHIEGFEGHEA